MESLLANFVLFYAILVLINLPVPFLGLKFSGNEVNKRLWFEPPGYVIPIVWVVLFFFLAILRYKLLEFEANDLAWLVIFLAVLCASYAYYTLGLEKLTGISALKLGLVGNILVILAGLWVGAQVGDFSSKLSYLVFPVVVWTFYATMILIGQLRLAGN
ncbi:TspO/MBR family protein [Algoriphagus mannitolivorans]|uniref:TspO/MBR family protein n=1 Tax=Algoriphagus mannitolivorans TaxID=226504 RepID=UPI0003FE08A3|nr:TspO/MBR family protein [Algoriphagus mannitolivorans]